MRLLFSFFVCLSLCAHSQSLHAGIMESIVIDFDNDPIVESIEVSGAFISNDPRARSMVSLHKTSYVWVMAVTEQLKSSSSLCRDEISSLRKNSESIKAAPGCEEMLTALFFADTNILKDEKRTNMVLRSCTEYLSLKMQYEAEEIDRDRAAFEARALQVGPLLSSPCAIALFSELETASEIAQFSTPEVEKAQAMIGCIEAMNKRVSFLSNRFNADMRMAIDRGRQLSK